MEESESHSSKQLVNMDGWISGNQNDGCSSTAGGEGCFISL